MTLLPRYVLIVALGLAVGACRQADGQMPAPSDDVQAELVDVARDLQNIASGRDPQASADLVADLRKYAGQAAAEGAVDELSRRAATAVTGVELPDQSARQLAHSLWTSIAARELSERQIEELQNETRELLLTFGVNEGNAQQVAAQVGEVQGLVGARPRRWYEVF
jgi:hypothetical protein